MHCLIPYDIVFCASFVDEIPSVSATVGKNKFLKMLHVLMTTAALPLISACFNVIWLSGCFDVGERIFVGFFVFFFWLLLGIAVPLLSARHFNQNKFRYLYPSFPPGVERESLITHCYVFGAEISGIDLIQRK